MAVEAEAKSLVGTEWLEAHLGQPDLRIVDATYYLPMQNKSARAEYDQRHIPGAVFFDVDEISDKSTDLPHMLPPADKFGSRVKKLGIGDGSRIVVYDGNGGLAAPRVWWTFRIFGHRDVAVLDGGLMKWMAEDRPLEDMPPAPRERHFTPRLDNTMVRSKQQLLDNLGTKREQVLGCACGGPLQRHRAGALAGSPGRAYPGSLNLPYAQLLRPDGTFLPADQLRAKFAAAGIDPKKPVVTSCGSGITASVLALGLDVIGHRDVAVYDGSWAEWGLPGDTPVEPEPQDSSLTKS